MRLRDFYFLMIICRDTLALGEIVFIPFVLYVSPETIKLLPVVRT